MMSPFVRFTVSIRHKTLGNIRRNVTMVLLEDDRCELFFQTTADALGVTKKIIYDSDQWEVLDPLDEPVDIPKNPSEGPTPLPRYIGMATIQHNTRNLECSEVHVSQTRGAKLEFWKYLSPKDRHDGITTVYDSRMWHIV